MDNSYANFQKTRKVVADFNIGGKRVNRAILNFEKVSDEILSLLGITQAKTYVCTASTTAGHKTHKDVASYDRAMQELAQKYSGAELDMSAFCPKKAEWDFAKGEAKVKKTPEEQLREDLEAGKVDEARITELMAFLEKAQKGLRK